MAKFTFRPHSDQALRPADRAFSFDVGSLVVNPEAGLVYENCIFSAKKAGCLASTRQFRLEEESYTIIIFGEAFGHHGLADCFLEISEKRGQGTLLRQSLLSGLSYKERELCSMQFLNPLPIQDLELSIFTSSNAHIRIDSILVIRAEYMHNFAILNKSYSKDLLWSVILYRSWNRFVEEKCPFYIVVPEKDLVSFIIAFLEEQRSGFINRIPNILAEEWIFCTAHIDLPSSFSGWHAQQIVKLCFAKTRIARNYLTMDSSMVFTKKFCYSSLLSNGAIHTAANRVKKQDFFAFLRRTEENGWLDGKLVNISESFNRICEFMDNKSESTNGYISCTGMFDSELSEQLDSFARSKGVNGYVGLIEMAPYEFAWYGEFVFTQRNFRFTPHDPHLMTLAHAPEHVTAIQNGEFSTYAHHFGVMFQLPAADLCDPGTIYDLVREGRLK